MQPPKSLGLINPIPGPVAARLVLYSNESLPKWQISKPARDLERWRCHARHSS